MEPLANRLRPTTLDDFIGQAHLVGAGKPIRLAIEQKKRFSFLLWGPPGVGKTTLARIYAQALGARFYELSAVAAGKGDITKIVDEDTGGEPKVLFLDEIHRFNKAQQDYLLPFVEKGVLTLVGATTENPSFEVNRALLSRCRVFTLEQHTEEDMRKLFLRAVPGMADEALDWLVAVASGDARQGLTILDATMALYDTVTLEHLKEAVQSRHLKYDKGGEEHHNIISAFIKSMRASQPDAALYYLARMTESGEDPLYIARRMIIFASEDVGLAQPTALVVANAVFQACQMVGYPECSINLAHAAAYLATAKKDRSAYEAFRSAEGDVRALGELPVPMLLRNPVTSLMKDAGYGKGYELYTKEDLMPEKLQKKKYFNQKG
jgi:putative ATPase